MSPDLRHVVRAGGKGAALLAAAVFLLTGSGASAGNPWQLRCPSMPAEEALPAPLRAVALRFYPWVKPKATGLRSGPIYLVALSTRTRISRDGDERDGAGYYLHRALVAITPTYTGALTLRGHRLGHAGRRTTLGFSIDGATRCTVKAPVVSCGSRPLHFATRLRIVPSRSWRIIRTELRIGRTGCFRLTASGRALHETIPLAIPGPDYGTAGW